MNPPLDQQSTATANPLAGLRDIHGPLEPGFWPPSWEFWLVFTAVVALCVIAFICIKKMKGPAWHNEAIALVKGKLKILEQAPSNENIMELNQALKRIALSLHPREHVAHLHGEAWCKWLDTQGQCNHFTQGVGQCLGIKAYSSSQALDAASIPLLRKIVLEWLQSQKNGTLETNLDSTLNTALHKRAPQLYSLMNRIKSLLPSFPEKTQQAKKEHSHD